jgi:hypothetical protein
MRRKAPSTSVITGGGGRSTTVQRARDYTNYIEVGTGIGAGVDPVA